MSPALLSKRLRSLSRAGLVERRGHGQRVEYLLTRSGQDLVGVVQAIGVWGLRWVPELGDEDYDPHLLMWDLRRTVPVDRWPAGRTAVELRLADVAPRRRSWWLVVTDGQADVCDVDPGHEVAAVVCTDLRTLTRIWRGEQSWDGALRRGTLDIDASTDVRRSLPGWLGQSRLARLAQVTS
jgi:hypothetical protein